MPLENGRTDQLREQKHKERERKYQQWMAGQINHTPIASPGSIGIVHVGAVKRADAAEGHSGSAHNVRDGRKFAIVLKQAQGGIPRQPPGVGASVGRDLRDPLFLLRCEVDFHASKDIGRRCFGQRFIKVSRRPRTKVRTPAGGVVQVALPPLLFPLIGT